MTIDKNVNGNEVTLVLKGWLDTQAAGEVGQAIEELPGDCQKLVLDFAELEYISSSGVRQVVAAYKKMAGNLVIKNTPDSVLNVFKSIGIDKKVRFE